MAVAYSRPRQAAADVVDLTRDPEEHMRRAFHAQYRTQAVLESQCPPPGLGS